MSLNEIGFEMEIEKSVACLRAVKRNQNSKSHSFNKSSRAESGSVTKTNECCALFLVLCLPPLLFYFCSTKSKCICFDSFSPIFRVVCSFRLSWRFMCVCVSACMWHGCVSVISKRLACWSVTCEILTAITTALCHHAQTHTHTHTSAIFHGVAAATEPVMATIY